MTARLRTVALVASIALCLPTVAVGQKPSVDSLLRRIEALERKNTALEQRVGELEAMIRGERPQVPMMPASSKWQDLANWRQLRRGMTEKQVRDLLGEPERVDAGAVTWWRWGDANVTFMDNRVYGWSEP